MWVLWKEMAGHYRQNYTKKTSKLWILFLNILFGCVGGRQKWCKHVVPSFGTKQSIMVWCVEISNVTHRSIPVGRVNPSMSNFLNRKTTQACRLVSTAIIIGIIFTSGTHVSPTIARQPCCTKDWFFKKLTKTLFSNIVWRWTTKSNIYLKHRKFRDFFMKFLIVPSNMDHCEWSTYVGTSLPRSFRWFAGLGWVVGHVSPITNNPKKNKHHANEKTLQTLPFLENRNHFIINDLDSTWKLLPYDLGLCTWIQMIFVRKFLSLSLSAIQI